jgi:hypothetical protein
MILPSMTAERETWPDVFLKIATCGANRRVTIQPRNSRLFLGGGLRVDSLSDGETRSAVEAALPSGVVMGRRDRCRSPKKVAG